MLPMPDEHEEDLIRAVATENAHAIEAARRRAERELRAAKEALESKAQALALALDEAQQLRALGRDLAQPLAPAEVARTVCRWARSLTAADGAAFILREGDRVHYLAEDALAPLWAGQRFPIDRCVSGWAIVNRLSVTIEDVYTDPRIPLEAYRPTFVKSLLMVPVREADRGDAAGPPAAIGVYWQHRRAASADQVRVLEAVADAGAVAFDRARLLAGAQAAQRSAERESRAKDEFLAMLSHELRNPLGVVASAARLLGDVAQGSPTAARAHAVIARQVDHLRRLVDDLLDVGRVTTGKIELSRRPIDVAALVESLMAAWRVSGRFEEHAVAVSTEPVWIDADETRLEQIVSNLVANALKFTPAGGAVTVRVRPDGETAVLEVEDRGAGIPPELLGRVFELFFQGEHAPDRAQGGLGIGLTLVRRLVELHDGTVAGRSAGPGLGSVFTVRLPAIAPRVAAAAPRPERLRPTPRTILVVEDNDDAREMLRTALELAGHTVFEASTGGDGIAAATSAAPEVALIDVGLPGLDGYEVARRIRAALGRTITLVALTGYGSPEDRRRAAEAGFDEHLVKPVDPVRLAGVLARLSAGE